jgi:hypothetical protein
MEELDTILFDRTRAEHDWACQRYRYYGFEFGGRGIAPTTGGFDAQLGTLLHRATETFAKTFGEQRDILGEVAPQIGSDARQLAHDFDFNAQRVQEWGALAEGIIRGFYRHVWTRFMRDYEIVAIEPECELPIDSPGNKIIFMSRPDLILRDRRTGAYVYADWKSTSWNNEKWINSWSKKIQLHSGMRAATKTLGVHVEYAIIVGLYKGFEKYDRRNSVFTYGFVHEGQPGILDDQFSYEYMRAKGWQRFGLTQGTIANWVENMPEATLAAQFPETPLIPIRDDLVDKFVQQRGIREADIRNARETMKEIAELDDGVSDEDKLRLIDIEMNSCFSQNFDRCEPAWGYPCNMRDLCWQSAIRADPLGSGMFQWRDPHHAAERKQMGFEEGVE